MSCRKEETVTVNLPSQFYQLPQGNHSYDTAILKLYEKYQTYFLYKFDSIDYAYDMFEYLNVDARQGNEAYIQSSLDFINDQLLSLYPDSFLQRTMPQKVILAAAIDSFSVANGTKTYFKSGSNFFAGKFTLIFGYADSVLASMSAKEKKSVRGFLNRCYFERALLGGSLTVPPAFAALQPPKGYGSDVNSVGYYYQFGIIEYKKNGNALSLSLDFLSYINAITSRTKEELEATILNPAVDVTGVIRKKYYAIIDYYKTTYQADLQAIGNHPI